MVPTFTNRVTSAFSANQSAYVTASISPSADSVLFAGIAHERVTSATAIEPTLSGGGVSTWTLVGTLAANTRQRMSIFRAETGSSPTSGAVTIDFAAETQDVCGWSIIEATNVLLTGTNAADAVAQFASSSSPAGTAFSVTLGSALGADNNRLLGFGLRGASGGTVTWDTGYADVTGAQASSSGLSLVAGSGRNGSSQVLSGTWSAGGDRIEVVIEVVGASDLAPEASRTYPRMTRKRLSGGLL